MKIGATKGFKVNMGNYESEEVSATVFADSADVYGDDESQWPTDPDEHAAGLEDFVRRRIKTYLDAELEEAAEVSQAKESILPEPRSTSTPATPPRRERTRNTTTRSTR